MTDRVEDSAPASDDGAVATLIGDRPGEVDVLTLCEIWRALDFGAPATAGRATDG